MKLRTFLTLAFASFSAVSLNATVTDVTWQDDGDGAVVCATNSWGGGSSVYVYGDQYSGPGHVNFTVLTDTPDDPTLTLFNSIDNDTSFAWTGYEVDVFMNKTFTLSGAAVVLPGGWSATTVQPGAPVGGIYTGQMIFTGGAPVPVNGSLDFAFTVSFLGGASFTEQLTPTPEPATLSLILCGSMVFGFWAARRR